MIKSLRKNAMLSAALFAASFSVNAQTQTPVVDENFQSWNQQGYSSYTDCETTTNAIEKKTYSVTKMYSTGQVTYKLDTAAVSPTCNYRTGTNATCIANSTTSNGYIYLDKSGGMVTTSAFQKVDSVELRLSYTGSYRQATLQKSTDDGATWVEVGTSTGTNCSQYGETFIFKVDASNVKLRVIPAMSNHPSNPNQLQNVRIHDLKVYGTIGGSTTAVRDEWSESGISLAVDDNNVTLSSDLKDGSVSIVSYSGVVLDRKEIQRGTAVSFAVPAGFYLVRFISNASVYSRKVWIR